MTMPPAVQRMASPRIIPTMPRRCGAERQADAELPFALRHQERHQAVKSECRQQQSDPGEQRQQPCLEARPRRQFADMFVEAADGHRQGRIDGRDFGSQPGAQRVGSGSSPDADDRGGRGNVIAIGRARAGTM